MLNATMPTKNKIHNTKIPKTHNQKPTTKNPQPKTHNQKPTTKNPQNYEFSRKIRKLY